jgi:hypothetical protein
MGMFDLNVDHIGAKVYFMERHWDTPEMMGSMLLQAFEVFQMDVGLQDNIVTPNFSTVSCLLAQHWFFDMWQLCNHFKVFLVVNTSNNVPMVR